MRGRRAAAALASPRQRRRRAAADPASSDAYDAMILDAYDCTMPAADPFLGVHRELHRRARPSARATLRSRAGSSGPSSPRRAAAPRWPRSSDATADDAECPDAANRLTQPARRARAIEVHDVGRRVADLERGGVRQISSCRIGSTSTCASVARSRTTCSTSARARNRMRRISYPSSRS